MNEHSPRSSRRRIAGDVTVAAALAVAILDTCFSS